MFRYSRALLFSAGIVKKTTGLVGLPVEPNARAVLTALYEKTLKDLQVASRCLRVVHAARARCDWRPLCITDHSRRCVLPAISGSIHKLQAEGCQGE
jgi:hypothetical protein